MRWTLAHTALTSAIFGLLWRPILIVAVIVLMCCGCGKNDGSETDWDMYLAVTVEPVFDQEVGLYRTGVQLGHSYTVIAFGSEKPIITNGKTRVICRSYGGIMDGRPIYFTVTTTAQ